MSFTEEEIAYIRSQPLARLSTVDTEGLPDVVPVGLEWDGEHCWVDDLVSFDPFTARGIRIYGVAEQPFERVGMVGPGVYPRIKPTVSCGWNLVGEPAGQEWYPTRKAIH